MRAIPRSNSTALAVPDVAGSSSARVTLDPVSFLYRLPLLARVQRAARMTVSMPGSDVILSRMAALNSRQEERPSRSMPISGGQAVRTAMSPE